MTIAIAIAVAMPSATRKCESYGRTDVRTNEEVTNPPLKSFTSVPHARIPSDRRLAATAALRASLNHTGNA